MAQSRLLTILMALCVIFSLQLSSSFAQMLPNTISAAPALLPSTSSPPPQSSSLSPALSPDITPLFPSPAKGDQLSPSESSLPTIPSSPSPPNPDDISTFGPNTMAISPSGSLPVSSSVGLGSTFLMVVMSIGAFWSFHVLI
uniref:classical arabinogalactan protein 26 n=1 Tax=Erigeron canadensis TaxID=72917 RepID=UPI001CB95A84|nr:classical arabinogalactan protein 26 [Erigeron canadensis]